jgi:DNA-binding LacI/PurR family transcriptional regulator/DNA-binding transcriptional regulator YhcF (GntR family)
MDDDLARLPAYVRIGLEIKRRIVRLEWLVGQPLPPQRQLALEYKVTTVTLNRAIGELITEGILTTSSGHGTFVARMPTLSSDGRVASEHKREGPAGIKIAVLAPSDHDPLKMQGSTDPLTDEVVRGIEQVATAAQAHVTFYQIFNQGFKTVSAAVTQARADGAQKIIVADIANYGITAEAAATLAETDLPNIFIAATPNDFAISQVGYSQRQAGFIAGRHLVEMGYRHLVVVHAVDLEWHNQRIAGVLNAAATSGKARCDILEAVVPLETFHGMAPDELERVVAGYVTALRQFAWWGTQAAAMVLPHDHTAIMLMKVLRSHGLEPGRDVGVIGFDNTSEARIAGLSSVHPPIEALGAFAAESVLRTSEGNKNPVHTMLLQSKVIGRNSTRR